MEMLKGQDNFSVVNGAKIVRSLRIKRCPDCYTNIPVHATQCPSCKQKIKLKVDKHGYAKRPINWFAYFSCFISWLGLVIYIWWAFFKE